MEMEAPMTPKPVEISNQNIDITEYIYSLNNEDYSLSIYIDNITNKLIIKAIKKNSINDKIYLFESTFENLKSINKYFTLFDSISEVKEEIKIYFSDKQIVITKPNNNEIKIQLKLKITKKIGNIEFILSGQNMSKDVLIDQLISTISSLENENKILKNQINELYSLFSEEINHKKIMKTNIIGQNDTIIKFKNYDLIKKGILSTNKNTNNINDKKENDNLKLNLIYKATRDGGSADIFHKFCDGKGPLVCVINTEEGITFGGYTEKKWEYEGGDKEDNNAFLFNFNCNKIYRCNGQDDAVKFEKDKGPYFCYAINIQENFFEKEINCVRSKNDIKTSWKNFEKDYELNGGSEYINLKELEVYEVNLD